jgi:MFS transporter, DHA3 family, macrolide efflux protein
MLAIKPVLKEAHFKKKIKENIFKSFIYVFSKRSIISIVSVVAILHFFVGSVQVIMPVFAITLKGNGAKKIWDT